jgi:hypothetical protein
MRAKEFIIENRIRNQETADSYLYNETDDINNNISKKWFTKLLIKTIINNPEFQNTISPQSKLLKTDWDKKDAANGTLVNFNYQKAVNYNEYETEIEHIKDWLKDMPEGHPFEKALKGIQTIDIANQWADKYFAEKNKSIVVDAGVLNGCDVIDIDGNMKWVEVQTPEALNIEGKLMQHCVGSYAERVSNGRIKILSLRDSKNQPHCTLEVRGNDVHQIKGKQNKAPVEKYIPYIKRFILKTKLDVVSDMSNIGLIRWNGQNYDVNEIPDGSIIDDLDVRVYKTLIKLPNNLTIKRNLWLGDCTNLKELPDNLAVHGHVTMNDCASLEKIGKNIRIGGDLNMQNCISITQLPYDLNIGTKLIVNGCTALKSIILKHCPPDIIAVGCTSLIELPDDKMDVGWLCLNDCISLTKLPNKLSCRDLSLRNCIGITELPKDLECKVLDLRGCINLKEIPETLQMDWRDGESKIIIDDESNIIIPKNKFRIQRALTSLK